MSELRLLEVREAPLNDPASLESRHPDSRTRAAPIPSPPLHLPCCCEDGVTGGGCQVAAGLYNSLGPDLGTVMDSEPEKQTAL